MLENIIKSKRDSAVLALFLASPPRSFSVLEVSRRLGLGFLRTAHILSRLSGEELLKNFSKKGKKYYLLNTKHRLLPEIKEYIRQNGPKYQDELFSAIKRLGDIRAAFLSGIFTGYPNLPVDLLLVGRVNLDRLSEFLKSLEKLMGQEINYSIMAPKEFELRRDTFDKFIRDIFDYRFLTVCDQKRKRG